MSSVSAAARSTTLRGMTRRWQPRTPVEVSAGASLVQRVLTARGLTDPETSKAFLHPALTQLHDPSLIPDLDRAATRLLEALKSGEPIAIYGDYDVDGVTATAILYHTLLALSPGASVRTYVPHRLEEGYGLNEGAVRQLAAEGARVIVSVDCGITATLPARAAREAGADLIITDHHNPPAAIEDLPPAYAVVHPRRPDSAYPFHHLSGAGVAYKLAWRLATMHCGSSRVSASMRTLLIDLLAFAALGAVADVMPLVGENRVLARFGLARVKQSSFEGLRALVEASRLTGENIDSEHAGFALAPRLNACGRLGHARDAVELFTTATGPRAAEIAGTLSKMNDQRRRMEQKIAEEATRMALDAGMGRPERRAIVLAHEEWHPGVLGIVCSRLVERFHRPAILMQRQGEHCHGSGRSIEGYSLHAGLAACAAHLTQFGGHDMAAGVKLRAERLDAFAAALDEHARGAIGEELLTPALRYDTEASLDELTPGAVDELGMLAPFGTGNARPRVLLRGLALAQEPKVFGSDGKHVGLIVRGTRRDAGALGGGQMTMRLIAWKWAERAAGLTAGRTLDAIVSPKLSTWNGRSSVEPELEDLRLM